MNGNDDDRDEHSLEDCARAQAARKGSPFLNTAQAAHYLNISARTLKEMRHRGDGPSFRRHGRQFRYHIADLDAWSLGETPHNATPHEPSDDDPKA